MKPDARSGASLFCARGILPLEEYFCEIIRQVERKRGRSAEGSPGESLGDHFRSLVVRYPALDQPRIQIDDPVLWHVSLIGQPLGHPIVPAAAWRENLHRKQHFARRHFRQEPTRFGNGKDEHVWLNEELGLRLEVERRLANMPHGLRLQIRRELAREE